MSIHLLSIFVCLGVSCLSFFLPLPPLLTLSCHWGFDQWLAFEKQVLSLVSSHLWCELQTAKSKVHTQNVCAFSIKVLSILLLITAYLYLYVPPPPLFLSVSFSWCKRACSCFKWDFWWKQVSFYSFIQSVLLKVLCVAFLLSKCRLCPRGGCWARLLLSVTSQLVCVILDVPVIFTSWL